MSEHIPVSALAEQWEAARLRTFLARNGHETVTPEDYWAELRLGTEIARGGRPGRWCAVADLLRLGEVKFWAEVGTVLGMSETEARDGFHAWVAGQQRLYEAARVGFTAAEADDLRELAESVML